MTTATPINRASRYIDPEVLEVVFVPVLDSIFGDDVDLEDIDAEALRDEISAGTDLSCELAETAGWTVSSSLVDTPDLCSRYTARIAGRVSADDSSLTFYYSEDSTEVPDLLPRRTRGYILMFDQGDNPGEPATAPSGAVFDAFPVEVTSLSKARSVEGTSAKTIMVSFAVVREPVENIEVPPHEFA